MEKRDSSNVGEYQHLPLTVTVSYSLPYPADLSFLNNLRAWGERQKVCHDIAFLLVLAKEEATGAGNMVY